MLSRQDFAGKVPHVQLEDEPDTGQYHAAAALKILEAYVVFCVDGRTNKQTTATLFRWPTFKQLEDLSPREDPTPEIQDGIVEDVVRVLGNRNIPVLLPGYLGVMTTDEAWQEARDASAHARVLH